MRDNKTEKIILEAAEQEFLLKGFAGTRTTEIASRAGVNHAMLHYYFDTKEQLFEKVLAEKMELFRNSVVSVFEINEMPIKEMVSEAMSRHFDFLQANPSLPRFLLNEVISRQEYMARARQAVTKIAEEPLRNLQQRLDDAAECGEICRIDAIMLLMDIASLNIFAFMVEPIVSSVGIGGESFYQARKAENIRVIMQRLTPNSEPLCNEMYY